MVLNIPDKEFEAFMSAIAAYYKYYKTVEPLAARHEDNRAHTQSAN